VTLQDIGSIGELVGAIATVATLAYLAIQIRHNNRGLDQNSALMRMTYENQIRQDGQQLRALIASDAELSSIWRAGLAGGSGMERPERDRFELLVINVLNMLKLHHDGMKRDLTTNTQPYLLVVASTPGFADWWRRHRGVGSDTDFNQWIDSLTQGESRSVARAAQQADEANVE
jgi:hypothetical protein